MLKQAKAPDNIVLFMHCGGQDDNIGDVVLRRAMFRRFDAINEKYVLVVDQSEAFEEGLELNDNVRIVRSRAEFKRLMLARSQHDRVIFVENAGELQSRLRNVARQLETVTLLRALSKSGGHSFKLGVGYRGDPGFYRHVLAWALQHYSIVRWRDGHSRAWTGVGDTMPDWGFVDTGPSQWQAKRHHLIAAPPQRDKLVVSLRYDRPFPSSNWIEGVRRFCRTANFEPVVATQVRRDTSRSKELAAALGANELGWPADTSHNEHEMRLRELYRSAALVVSDRLHVLILAFTEGAVPFNLAEYQDRKTARHFDVIGFGDSAINAAGASVEEIDRFLSHALKRKNEMPGYQTKIDAEMVKLDNTIASLCGMDLSAGTESVLRA